MNKRDLNKILKPLIKECVKEVIFEEGALSKIISEVMVGLAGTQQLVEERVPEPEPRKMRSQEANKLRETKKRMLDAIGGEAYAGVDLFEGTTPLSSGGTPGSAPTPHSPLSGMSPSDKGVDITKSFPEAPEIWKKLI